MAVHSRARSFVKDPPGPAVQLVLAAATVALLLGVVFVAPLPLWAGQPMPAPARDAPPVSPLGWPALLLAAIFLLGSCLPFRFYSRALEITSTARISNRLLFGLTVFLALVALLIYPRFGSDIFDYLGFERMWLVFGDNPLLATPISHPTDWSTAFVWYPRQSPAYGPLWALLTWPLVRVLGDSPDHAVLGYKMLALAGYGICCVLVWHIAEPARRARALLLFAWSPLVLFEVLGKVHNDILVAVGALSAVWLVGRSRPRAGALATLTAVAAALIKLTSLAVMPPLVLRMWRTGGLRAVVPSLIGAALLMAMLYAPFWAGAATFEPLLHQTGRVVWSPAALLIALTDPAAASAIRLLLAIGGVAVYAAFLLRAQLHAAADLAATTGKLLMISLLLFTSAVFAHYLVPVIALAAVANDRRLEHAAFWLSVGGLAAYAVEILGAAFGSDWLGSRQYQLLGSMVLLGPLVLAYVLSWRSPAASREIIVATKNPAMRSLPEAAPTHA